jgi:RNA polymerase sigma-70 factor (ECF subfamily)
MDQVAAAIEQEVVGLHEEHSRGLLHYAASLMGSEDVAADAVQEVFLRYFVERRYGRTIESPRAWLYHVLHNYLMDRLKAFPVRRQVDPQCLEYLPATEENPEEVAQHAEMAQHIAALLTARELDCVRLRAQGLSYNEIATVLAIQPGTVGALLNRVHRKLQESDSSPQKRGLFEIANALRYLVREALVYSSA